MLFGICLTYVFDHKTFKEFFVCGVLGSTGVALKLKEIRLSVLVLFLPLFSLLQTLPVNSVRAEFCWLGCHSNGYSDHVS